MSWGTDDGAHEGYVAALFSDGMAGGSVSSAGIEASTTADGVMLPYKQWVLRQPAEIVAWEVRCHCSDHRGRVTGRVGWRGSRWDRVTDPALHDVGAGRVYVEDDDAVWVEDTYPDVDAVALASWRGHYKPDEHLAAIGAATDDLRAAVGQAREHGTEWSAIARATGLDVATAERLWGLPSLDRTSS